MRVADLSLAIGIRTTPHPAHPRRMEVSTVTKSPGHWQASWIGMSAHMGSHVDSPLHCLPGGHTIGETPLENLVGEAVLLDLTHKEANSAIDAGDLRGFYELIGPGDIAVLYTGWSDRTFGKDEFFTQSPYLTPEGARWLADRKVKAVGFDFVQEYHARFADFTPADFTAHRVLMESGVTLLEGMTNLVSVGSKRFLLVAAPLKLMDTEAAPARFLALMLE